MTHLNKFTGTIKNLLQITPDKVMIVDYEGKIEYLNDAFLFDIGIGRKEIVGKKVTEFIGVKAFSEVKKDITKKSTSNLVIPFTKLGKKTARRIFAFKITSGNKIVGIAIMIPDLGVEQLVLKKNLFQFSILRAMNVRKDAVYFMANVITGKNTFMSDSAKTIFGFDPENFKLGGWVYFYSLVHPNDLESVYFSHTEWLIMKNKLGLLYEHIEYTNSYRIRTDKDVYVSVDADSNVLERDENGRISTIFGSFRLIDEETRQSNLAERGESPVKWIDGKAYVEIDHLKFLREQRTEQSFKKVFKDLSTRETETLELIIEELKSEEIAERLNISIHTVNLHRKQIMKKLGVKTMAGLVKKYYLSEE